MMCAWKVEVLSVHITLLLPKAFYAECLWMHSVYAIVKDAHCLTLGCIYLQMLQRVNTNKIF